jgi:hypothetical protein
VDPVDQEFHGRTMEDISADSFRPESMPSAEITSYKPLRLLVTYLDLLIATWKFLDSEAFGQDWQDPLAKQMYP